MMGGHGGGVVRDTYAIVEYEDGSIGRIAPEKIKFSDNLFEKYKEDAESWAVTENKRAGATEDSHKTRWQTVSEFQKAI